jgi:hypothetical protein
MKEYKCKCGETHPDKFRGRSKSTCKKCHGKRSRDRYRNLSESDKKAYINNASKNYKKWSKDNVLRFRLTAARNRAKQKGIDFSINLPYLELLLNKQNGMCPYLKIKLTHTKNALTTNGGFETISIDRIDSSKGYIKGNVELVSGIINSMKNTLSKEEFIHTIKWVYNNL